MTAKVTVRRAGGVLVAALLVLPQLASAAISCVGTANEVLLYADGTLNVRGSWSNDKYTYLCSTTGSWGTVPTEVCLGWYGLLTKAAADQKTVMLWYSNWNDCTTLPEYSASLVPTYVGLKRQTQ